MILQPSILQQTITVICRHTGRRFNEIYLRVNIIDCKLPWNILVMYLTGAEITTTAKVCGISSEVMTSTDKVQICLDRIVKTKPEMFTT